MELNEEYKKRHKPQRQTEKQRHHQGYFTPTVHPEKCLTRINEFRSLWELYFMEWADRCDDVLRWASEPIYIEYRNPLANKKYCDENHLDWRNPIYWKLQKYHVDFWIELRGKNGQGVRKIFIEVKPYNQSVPPKMPAPNAKASEFRSYNHLAEQFLVNNQKWQAAKKFCEERGTEFIVVTEVTLKKLGILH